MADGEAIEVARTPESPDALWDDWETPPRVPGTPELHLDGFDGSLDLLLDLAERERIDLGRLSICALIDQFAAALVRYETHVPIERRADWLILAARLIVLRSRLLFATDPAAANEAELEAARELAWLRDRQFVRAAADWLEARPQPGRDVFTRPARDRDPRVASYMQLMEACLAVLEREEAAASEQAEAVYRPAVAVLNRIPDVLARMRAKLATLTEPAPLRTFLPRVPTDAPDRELLARSAVSSTLLAALELGRNGELSLIGGERFEVVRVEAGEAGE